jgi:hypothetical protein
MWLSEICFWISETFDWWALVVVAVIFGFVAGLGLKRAWWSWLSLAGFALITLSITFFGADFQFAFTNFSKKPLMVVSFVGVVVGVLILAIFGATEQSLKKTDRKNLLRGVVLSMCGSVLLLFGFFHNLYTQSYDTEIAFSKFYQEEFSDNETKADFYYQNAVANSKNLLMPYLAIAAEENPKKYNKVYLNALISADKLDEVEKLMDEKSFKAKELAELKTIIFVKKNKLPEAYALIKSLPEEDLRNSKIFDLAYIIFATQNDLENLKKYSGQASGKYYFEKLAGLVGEAVLNGASESQLFKTSEYLKNCVDSYLKVPPAGELVSVGFGYHWSEMGIGLGSFFLSVVGFFFLLSKKLFGNLKLLGQWLVGLVRSEDRKIMAKMKRYCREIERQIPKDEFASSFRFVRERVDELQSTIPRLLQQRKFLTEKIKELARFENLPPMQSGEAKKLSKESVQTLKKFRSRVDEINTLIDQMLLRLEHYQVKVAELSVACLNDEKAAVDSGLQRLQTEISQMEQTARDLAEAQK